MKRVEPQVLTEYEWTIVVHYPWLQRSEPDCSWHTSFRTCMSPGPSGELTTLPRTFWMRKVWLCIIASISLPLPVSPGLSPWLSVWVFLDMSSKISDHRDGHSSIIIHHEKWWEITSAYLALYKIIFLTNLAAVAILVTSCNSIYSTEDCNRGLE